MSSDGSSSKKRTRPVDNRQETDSGHEAEASGSFSSLDYRDVEALKAGLRQLLKQANRPLRMDEMLRISKLPRKAKKRVETALFALQDSGLVVRSGSGWANPARLRHMEGVLSVQRSGVGFVSSSQGTGPDVYIHPAAMGGAWHGDSVEVVLLPGRRGPNPEGRISRVLNRANKELPVYAVKRQQQGKWLCAPVTPRIQALLLTDVDALDGEVKAEDLLLVKPGSQIGPNLWEAVATLNLQHEETPAAQERLVKSSYEIPEAFPDAVLKSVAGLPEDPAEEDFAGRRDLRDCLFVTIDGRSARDFDDAILVEKAGSSYRLRVAIADVSHYVAPGTPLDGEARLRGNSYYFPLSVEPMLPEALSNGLCSLRPDVPRLAMVADMDFSPDGRRLRAEFYPAVIRSRARLTYGQIERGLLLHERADQEILEPVLPMLREAEVLAKALMEVRRLRGSLDFDVPEAEVVFDQQGMLTALVPRKRHFGHRLIEEFMIAANEAVAEYLQSSGHGTLYRVHEPPDPDKLQALLAFLGRTGLDEGHTKLSRPGGRGGPKKIASKDLAKLLDSVRGTPREFTVNRLLLRSMMQARYQPDNEGHFGLASGCYCHFTSPIRRYADLVTHRALKQALGIDDNTGKALTRARLEAVAEHCNATERTAAEAERELTKRLGVLLLRDRVGEGFAGIVSGVTDFGIFVELPSVMAEGMIRLADLTDDFYEFLPELQELRGRGTRRVFRVGQELTVILTHVNVARLEVDLSLESDGTGESRKRSTRQRRKDGGNKRPAASTRRKKR